MPSGDFFINTQIPVSGTPDSKKDGETRLNARETRLNLNIQGPTPLGRGRGFILARFPSVVSKRRSRCNVRISPDNVCFTADSGHGNENEGRSQAPQSLLIAGYCCKTPSPEKPRNIDSSPHPFSARKSPLLRGRDARRRRVDPACGGVQRPGRSPRGDVGAAAQNGKALVLRGQTMKYRILQN